MGDDFISFDVKPTNYWEESLALDPEEDIPLEIVINQKQPLKPQFSAEKKSKKKPGRGHEDYITRSLIENDSDFQTTTEQEGSDSDIDDDPNKSINTTEDGDGEGDEESAMLFQHMWINEDNSGLERPSRQEVPVAADWETLEGASGPFYFNRKTRTCCWSQPYQIPEDVSPTNHIPPLGVFSRKRKRKSNEALSEKNEDDGFHRARPWKKKKEGIHELTPDGKTPISFLQEYAINILKCNPQYNLTIQEDPSKPFVTTVTIKNKKYGIGAYINKKQSKQLAAENTLEILCPGVYPPSSKIAEDQTKRKRADSVLENKSELSIDDERVLMLVHSDKTPAQVLQEYCNREGITIEWKCESIDTIDEQSRFEISAVVSDDIHCKAQGRTKKDAKQRAAQKYLKMVHPNISSWTELLQLYAPNKFEKTKYPTSQLLSTLKDEMRKVIQYDHFENDAPDAIFDGSESVRAKPLPNK